MPRLLHPSQMRAGGAPFEGAAGGLAGAVAEGGFQLGRAAVRSAVRDADGAHGRRQVLLAAVVVQHGGLGKAVAGELLGTEMLAAFRFNWLSIKGGLVTAVDRGFGVYDGLTFKHDRFAAWLDLHDIPWPRTECGRLSLEDRHRQNEPGKSAHVAGGQG